MTRTVRPGTALFDQPVTLTATVHAAGAVAGTVTFSAGGTPRGARSSGSLPGGGNGKNGASD
jgi:hypothetical protein